MRKGATDLVIQLLIFVLLILVIPVWVGGIFNDVYRGRGSLAFRWLSGQFLLWAGFQLISVFLILKQEYFPKLVILYGIYIGAVMFFAAGAVLRQSVYGLDKSFLVKKVNKAKFSNLILWLCFLGLLGFQLLQAVRMAYADGDDAYYVAITSITTDADTMYLKYPYSGGEMGELDVRHALAPFPLWISFLAKVTGIQSVTMAQVVLPVALICMTYSIFYMLGSKLFPEANGQLPLFLIFTEVLVLFGDYSFSGMENFMIARTHQGKAVLGSIVIPFLLCLSMVLLRRLQKKEAVPVQLYLLYGLVAMTGCMCSTLGALLVCMAVGIVGILGAVCYKRLKILTPLALSCIPCICYAVVYLILS